MEDDSVNLLKVSTVYMNYCCAPCPESIVTVTCLNFCSVSIIICACDVTCILCIINYNLKLVLHQHTYHTLCFQCAISQAVSYSSCAQKVVTLTRIKDRQLYVSKPWFMQTQVTCLLQNFIQLNVFFKRIVFMSKRGCNDWITIAQT